MSSGDFHGEPTVELANEHVRVEMLAESGPRIVRLELAGSSENLLGEVPDVSWDTPWGKYRLRGGHRLWVAPENPPLTSAPEEGSLVVSEIPGGLRLERPEAPSGLRKAIEVTLAGGGPKLTVRHELRNEGTETVTRAAWGITIVPLGGVAILPQKQGPLDGSEFLPNRSLVLWPYSSICDPRIELGDDLVLMYATPGAPTKIGHLNRSGCAAYLNRGVLFCKHFEPQIEEQHADLGCNVEVYANERTLELETLGPLKTLAPGDSAVHVETWQLHRMTDETLSRELLAGKLAGLGLN